MPRDLKEVDPAKLQAALDRLLLRTGPKLCIGLAVLFTAAAVGDILLYEGSTGRLLATITLATAGMFIASGLVLHERRPGPRWAGPVSGLWVSLALLNAWMPGYLLGEAVLGVWLILLVVGAGLLLVSREIVLTSFAAAGVAWATISLRVPLDVVWSSVTFALAISMILGMAGHAFRRDELMGLVRLRILEARRRDELQEEVERRRQAQAALRDSEARLRRVVEGVPVALFVVDRDSVVTMAEGRGLEHLGLASEDLVGTPVDEVDGRVPVPASDVEAALDGAERGGEIEVGDRIFETRCSPLGSREGRPRAIAVAADVTSQRRAARRRAEIERLESINEFKTRLLNTASHELNTPLTPIKMQIRRLRRADGGPDGDRREALDVIEANIDRLSRLVEELLDVTRLESDGLPVEPEETDLSGLAAEATASFRAQAAAEGIDLAAELPETAPARVDPDRIYQVLANLLSNALKFTEEGGRVRLEVVGDGDDVVVRVRDDGIGMPPERIDEIFEPFSQLDEAPEGGASGRGLGLFISKGIVEAHGGSIDAASDGPGEGTTVTVRLPRSPPGDRSVAVSLSA